MKQNENSLIGRWKIVWMEMWDQDYVDMVVPGHVTISGDGPCHFQFGVVEGEFYIDTDDAYFDCDWDGSDECDEALGEIYAEIEEGELRGEISFRGGDESEFRAIKEEKKKRGA